MKIIDARIRPPFESIGAGRIFNADYATKQLCSKFGRGYPESAREKSMEILFNEMERDNIVKALMPIRRSQGTGMRNEDYILLNEKYPDRFIGFAGLDPTPWKLDDEKYFPIYEKCEKEHIPVYITWGGLNGTPWVYDPEIIDHVARTFPKMKMFLAHAGFPRSAEHTIVAVNHPNVYLGTDIYVINSPGQQDFIMAGNYACKNQICYGSAYPLAPIHEVVETYKKIFNEENWDNIFYNNIMSFLTYDEE